MTCRHTQVEPWPYDDRLRGCAVERRRCVECRELVGIGPANDTPEVLIEIRAVELAVGSQLDVGEDIGWLGAEDEGYLDIGPEYWHGDPDHWHAGYLARCIADHESLDRPITTGAEHVGLTPPMVRERQSEAERVEMPVVDDHQRKQAAVFDDAREQYEDLKVNVIATLIEAEGAARHAAISAKEREMDEHGYGGNAPAGEICADLTAFADGELPPTQAEAFRAHLPGCEACRLELGEVVALQAQMSTLMPDEGRP